MHPGAQIPEIGSYGKVLRRYDRDPRHAHQMRFVSYDCNIRAVPAELNGKTAPTLFFPIGKEKAADRAMRLGWIDATNEWLAMNGVQIPDERIQQLQQLDQQVRDMSWSDLQKYAHSLGVFGKVKRETMERRCFEVHRSMIAEDG